MSDFHELGERSLTLARELQGGEREEEGGRVMRGWHVFIGIVLLSVGGWALYRIASRPAWVPGLACVDGEDHAIEHDYSLSGPAPFEFVVPMAKDGQGCIVKVTVPNQWAQWVYVLVKASKTGRLFFLATNGQTWGPCSLDTGPSCLTSLMSSRTFWIQATEPDMRLRFYGEYYPDKN
jgi:hypothetical protein